MKNLNSCTSWTSRMKYFLPLILNLQIIILIVIGQPVYSQSRSFFKGYYTTIENDTVHGYIRNASRGNLSKKFDFKTDSASKTIDQYKPLEVNTFYYEPDNYFISYSDTVIQKTIFLYELTSGPVSLYTYYNIPPVYYLLDHKSEKTYRLSKENKTIEKDGRTYEQEDTRYKGVIRIAMSACPNIFNKIDRVGFNSSSLIKLVQEYNECIEPGIEKVNRKRKTKFQAGIQFGGNYPTLQRIYRTRYDGLDFSGKSGFVAGLAFNVSFERKISFDFSVLYAEYNSELLNYTFAPNLPYSENVYLKFTYIDIPVSIRYEILKSDFSPLLYGTYLLGFLLDEDIKVESNYPGAEPSRTVDHGFLKIGFAGGIGLSYKNRLLLKTGLFWQIGLDNVNVVTKIQGIEFNIAFFINKR